MLRLSEIASIQSGSPQARIKDSPRDDVPTYFFYGQSEMEDDLNGVEAPGTSKRIRTFDAVSTVSAGDIVFSLASGKCAIVQPCHSGYLITQNFLKIIPSPHIDPRFLAYMLNEDEGIRRQLLVCQQGSATMRFNIKQLSDLELPELPFLEVQKAIGDAYFSQLKLAALKARLAKSEVALLKMKLKEARRHG